MQLLLLLLVAFLSLSIADARPRHGRGPLSLPSSPSYTTSFERVRGVPYSVAYDERAIIVNGERVLLLSGSIHYPRFAEAEWAHQFNLSRMAGLNTIQTYVFWNWHESVKRAYDFSSESHNLNRFIELAGEYGLFVYLRIGPFVCSEWTYGGIPLWLREDKETVFRTNNTQWESAQYEMTVFVDLVMRMVQPLLARNGGPIILAQIENEYDNMEGRDAGNRAYIKWAGALSQAYDSGLVWGMCQSGDAPPPVIPTCNGLTCYDFVQPGRTMPALWTEHWSSEAWTWTWGSHLAHNSAENMAYAAARWFANGGAHINYYMVSLIVSEDDSRPWSGGTTPGRWTGGPLLVNSYDYESPITEYGLPTADKFPHLALLHYILQGYSSVILSQSNGIDRAIRLTSNVTLLTYGGVEFGLAMLVNLVNSPQTVNVTLDKARQVVVPGSSVLLYDWTTADLLFDSSDVSRSRRTLQAAGLFREYAQVAAVGSSSSATVLGWYAEPTAVWSDVGVRRSQRPLELLDLTRHDSDHLYYQTTVTLTDAQVQKGVVLLELKQVTNHFHVFLNHRFVAYGSVSASFPVNVTGLTASIPYNLTIVAQQDGVKNCCGGLEAFNEGILGDVAVDAHSLLNQSWLHLVGLQGEALALPSSPSSALWNKATTAPLHTPWVWYRLQLERPSPTPTAWVTWYLDLTASMTKGQVWVNGHALGRYWDIRDEQGHYTQQYNHVPDAWLKEGTNELVVWEELGGDPSGIVLAQKM